MENKKILIVEDDAILGKILLEVFLFYKWEPKLVQSGREALNAIPSYNPDVILSDINMPDMDGVEMLENLFNSGSLVPVVFLSGFRDTHKMTLAWKYCAYDFLDKPFKNDILMMTCAAAALYGKDYVKSARQRTIKSDPS